MSFAKTAEVAPPESGETRPVTAHRVREALDRLVADPAFKVSERNRRFLRFIVEEALAGRGERIKSYTIAVDVFGRGEKFDPATDPIVRIEATRLRAALAAYYSGQGRNEPVRITIPKGGYVPAFQIVEGSLEKSSGVEPASSTSTAAPMQRSGLARVPQLTAAAAIALAAILALGFSSWPFGGSTRGERLIVVVEDTRPLSGSLQEATTARGVTQSLVTSISRFANVTVTTANAASVRGTASSAFAGKASVLVLSSSVRIEGEDLHAWWSLAKADSGEVIWSDAVEERMGSAPTWSIENEIALGIADRIGGTSGGFADTGGSTGAGAAMMSEP